MNRKLQTFVTASILLNLLLAGMLIGQACRSVMNWHRHYTVKEIAEALPQEDRQRLQDTLGRAEQDMTATRKQLSDARDKAAETLKATPFDKKSYLAQMQKIHQLSLQSIQHMDEAVGTVSEQSSQEERAVLANMLRYAPRPQNGE